MARSRKNTRSKVSEQKLCEVIKSYCEVFEFLRFYCDVTKIIAEVRHFISIPKCYDFPVKEHCASMKSSKIQLAYIYPMHEYIRRVLLDDY